MKLVNNSKMPEPLFRAIQATGYAGELEPRFESVTGLLKPPYQRGLEILHRGALEADAASRLFAARGSAMHDWLAKGIADMPQSLSEERLRIKIGDDEITGGIDLYYQDEKSRWVLSDWKETSVYVIMFQSRLEDWSAQLNIYSYMLGELGFPVDRLSIVALARDWSKGKARLDKLQNGSKGTYPEHPWAEISIPMWPKTAVQDFLHMKIALHKQARAGLMGECGVEERWQKNSIFAVMKEGRKSAVRLLPSLQEAQHFIESADTQKSLSIIKREGARTRCEDYCDVTSFCPSFQEYLKNKLENKQDDV